MQKTTRVVVIAPNPGPDLSWIAAVDPRLDEPVKQSFAENLRRYLDGHVVAEGWWAPYSAERPQLLYSLSKSFTGRRPRRYHSGGRLRRLAR